MNTQQTIYAIALLAVALWRGWKHPGVLVLLANMVATLAACWAMDEGILGRTDATMSMMVIDFISGAVLLTGQTQAKVIAAGYGITVPIYGANIIFNVASSATFAVVIAIGFAQIMVAAIDTSGRDGLRNRGRRSAVGRAVAISAGHQGLGLGGLAKNRGGDRQ